MPRSRRKQSGIEQTRSIQENIRRSRSTVIVTRADGTQEEVAFKPPRNLRKERNTKPRLAICQYCKQPSRKTTCDACADLLGDAVFMSFDAAITYIEARRSGVSGVRAKLMARRASGQ